MWKDKEQEDLISKMNKAGIYTYLYITHYRKLKVKRPTYISLE